MKKIKLKDICNISAGGTPSRSNINYWNNGDIPWCKIGDFSGKYINQVKENITEEGLKNSSAKIFKRGTILYTIFATVGEVAILEKESATNQAIAGLEIINDEVDLEYLYYYLKSLKFVMLKKSRGVAQNNINLGILKNIEIKIPDKMEQINIAKILANIEKVIDEKNKQLKELNTIIKSQFVEMFGNIKNSKFDINSVKNLVDINIIKTKKKHKKGDVIKYVDISSINNLKNEIISYKEYEVGLEPSRAQQCLEKGDILISTVRPNLKNISVNNYEEDNIVGSSGFCVLRVNKCIKEYLFEVVKTEKFTNDMMLLATGANYPAIRDKDILDYKIAVPPITLQNQFSEIVKQIDKQKFESMIQLDKENRIVLKNIIKDTIEETNIIYEFLFKKYFEEGK